MHRAPVLGLHIGLDLEQLCGVVKGHHVVGVVHAQRPDAKARLPLLARLGQEGDHVREVFLALSIVSGQVLQGIAQGRGFDQVG